MKFQDLSKRQTKRTYLKIKVNKSYIRKKILKIRKRNTFKNIKVNWGHIHNVLKKKKVLGRVVGGYYPYNYEVDAIKILKQFEKKKYQISLPKIKNEYQMDFFQWSTKDPLTVNKYGIPEPTSNKILYPSILLVPLVAFDKYLNRVGYGGGFYDRYIEKTKQNKKILTIGLAYSFQEVKKIPTNKYDKKLDYILIN